MLVRFHLKIIEFGNNFEEQRESLHEIENQLSTADKRRVQAIFDKIQDIENDLNTSLISLNVILKIGFNPQHETCDRNAINLPERVVLKSPTGKDVLCDTRTDGGGWILIMRRIQGGVNFSRPWTDYRNGFGLFDGDFWLGLEEVHTLSNAGQWELRVDMKFEGKDYYANYNTFKIDSETLFYTLHVGQFSGNVGDDLEYHDGIRFYTYDRPTVNHCARTYTGGWWYRDCHHCYLTGVWRSKDWAKGVHWDSLSTSGKNLDAAEMKIRKVN
ncbi:ficolin-1-A-like [Physella acuta]|uniref:ficolin-1-A-like n=1 Tax=Physella acuta TaxID=109671 RepID=UPI0027DCB3A3|nr:ficolin-1-A-like [Physella acuta]